MLFMVVSKACSAATTGFSEATGGKRGATGNRAVGRAFGFPFGALTTIFGKRV
jgi:hypothetical protein